MRPSSRQPLNDLAELRRLIVRPEQEEIEELRERLDDKEQRAQEIAAVLPEAITLGSERTEELSRAIQPAVEGSVRESIEQRPQIFIEALHPIIGPVVRRSIAESLRGLLQSLNRSLEQSFSWQGLKWRFEAWRTGRSFAEVVLLRSLLYRVEQVFLIHRETSLALLHVSADPGAAQDSDMVAGMLSAIQDFARDSFHTGKDEGLEEFRVGELQVWIAPGPHAYLAAVIRGDPPRELRTRLEDTIERIHVLRGKALAKFNGDAAPFESLRPELEDCLRSLEKTKERSGDQQRAWAALAIGAALMVALAIVALRSEIRWHGFVRQLNATPGIAVTQAEKNWLRPSRISGLRDPAVADPEAVARAAGIDPRKVRFEWKDYLALDDASVLRRFVRRFGKPPGTTLSLTNGALLLGGSVPFEWFRAVEREGRQSPGVTSISEGEMKLSYNPGLVLERFRRAFPPPASVRLAMENGTLHLAGEAPYEWLAPVRLGATKLPGIEKISEKDLKIAYDPAIAVQRFAERFNLPDSVNAEVKNGVLTLSGEAPHAWLTRVRRGAPGLPGVEKIDEHNLIDQDQQAYEQSKSVIESAFVYFLVNKDNFATEGFTALSRLPDEIRRCLTATKRLGLPVEFEIRGYADAVGSETKNFQLSQGRADAVRDFLVKCGFDSSLFKSMGMGTPSTSDKAASDQAARRVEIKVVPKL